MNHQEFAKANRTKALDVAVLKNQTDSPDLLKGALTVLRILHPYKFDEKTWVTKEEYSRAIELGLITVKRSFGNVVTATPKLERVLGSFVEFAGTKA